MIRPKIKIGDYPLVDCQTAYNLIYVSSDKRFSSPIKKRDATSYPEEDGEHIDPRVVYDAFDYKVTFVIEAPNSDLVGVNAQIKNLNNMMFPTDSKGFRKATKVSFYNYLDRVAIVGYPLAPIAEATKTYRVESSAEELEWAQIELSIRVTNPNECNFNLPKQ